MNTASSPVTARIQLVTGATVLFTLAALAGCGTQLTPTVVEVFGQTVEVVETGSGEATVVFESGLGDDWSPWDQVAVQVAPHARVFAYSRPGYGASAPTTRPRNATQIVEELRVLLEARGHAPPYVLVGHSFGGTYLELFAKKYPAEVAALVLVDTRHRDFTAACLDAGIEGCAIPDSVVASLPPVQSAEYQAFASSSEEITASGGFGPHPVRVLSATSHGFTEDAEALWTSMARSLADEATDGEQNVFSGAGHYLQSDRTADVVQSILSVLPTTEF